MTQLLRVEARRSDQRTPRVNLIVPSVAASGTFGGIRTAFDLFEAVAANVPRRRIISVAPIPVDESASFAGYKLVSTTDDPDEARQLVAIGNAGHPTIPVGPADVFIATFWPTAELAMRLRRWQATAYGEAPTRFGYLIQDFEPSFYPSSAQSVLARATYDEPDSTVAIFNTSLLRDHFHGSGIGFGAEYAFEPRLPSALRTVLAATHEVRSRRIVVYGRPSKPRNGFPLLVDGLRRWRTAFDEASAWEVVSAGEDHPDVDLGRGATMRSVGKLDLGAYAELLRDSAVGVVLMLSPHPSYPPLEMAVSGMLVLTNRYGAKDLSTWHTNISSMESISEDGIADGLMAACRRFDSDAGVGRNGRLLHADYLDDAPQFPFAAEVVGALFGTSVRPEAH